MILTQYCPLLETLYFSWVSITSRGSPKHKQTNGKEEKYFLFSYFSLCHWLRNMFSWLCTLRFSTGVLFVLSDSFIVSEADAERMILVAESVSLCTCRGHSGHSIPAAEPHTHPCSAGPHPGPGAGAGAGAGRAVITFPHPWHGPVRTTTTPPSSSSSSSSPSDWKHVSRRQNSFCLCHFFFRNQRTERQRTTTFTLGWRVRESEVRIGFTTNHWDKIRRL